MRNNRDLWFMSPLLSAAVEILHFRFFSERSSLSNIRVDMSHTCQPLALTLYLHLIESKLDHT